MSARIPIRRAIAAACLALAACGDGPATSEEVRALGPPNPQLAASAADDLDVGGTFRTSVPIPAPAFYGLEPQLALVYDSSGGDGILGPGWAMRGFSRISRVGAKGGAPRFDATDGFVFDGMELLPCSQTSLPSASCTAGGTHTTRTESYLRVHREGSQWRITTKEGTVSHYEPEPVAASRGTTRWALARVIDLRGNRVDYTQWCDGTFDCYTSEITYGTPAAYASRVRFLYEDRPDPKWSATGEGLARTRKRLKTIDVQNAGERARVFALAYDRPADLGASWLTSVKEFDRHATVDAAGDVSGASLPARTFAREHLYPTPWTQAAKGIAVPFGPNPPTQPTATWRSDAAPGTSERRKTLVADVDGDGRADSVVIDFGANPVTISVTRAQRGGGFAPVVTQATPWPVGGRPMVTDANGDGHDDLWVIAGGGTSEVLHTALGQPDGTFDFQPVQSLGISRNTNIYLAGDVDGDGRTDLIAIQRSNQPTSFDTISVFSRGSSGALTVKTLATGLSSRGELDLSLDISQVPDARLPDPMWITGDANGDGRTDLFRFEAVPNGAQNQQLRVRTFLANDSTNGFDSTSVMPGVPWGMAHTRRTHDRMHAGDFNADGRTDLAWVNVMTHPSGPATTVMHVLLGLGDGTFQVTFFDTQMGPLLMSATTEGLPTVHAGAVSWMTGDVDGDRATDFVLALPPPGSFTMDTWPTQVSLIELISDRRGGFSARLRANTDWMLEAQLRCSTDVNGQVVCRRQLGAMIFDIALADVDGDARADVFYTLAGTGELDLRTDISPITAVDTHRWTPTDTNGDGRRDLVYPQFTGGGMRIYSSLSTPSFTRTEVVEDRLPGWNDAAVGGWHLVDIGGPDGPDGRADLVYVQATGRSPSLAKVFALLSNGDGTWTPVETTLTGTFARTSAWQPMDVNGDGAIDLVDVWRDPAGLRIVTLVSDGHGGFHRVDETAFPGYPAFDPIAFLPADLDGDGRGDLVSVVSPAAGQAPIVRSLRSNGAGTWLAATATAPTSNLLGYPLSVDFGAEVASFTPTDINGDGKTDLVRRRVPDLFSRWLMPGDVQVTMLISHGDGAFSSAESWPVLPDGAARREVASRWHTADVNDDGLADFVQVYGYDDPATVDDKLTITTMRNHRDGSFAIDRQTNLPHDFRDTSRVMVDDWDGDGRDGVIYIEGALSTHQGVWTPVVREFDSTRGSARLAKVSNGLGWSRDVVYRTTAGTHARMPVGMLMRVVERVGDEVLPQRQWARVEVSYEGARWDFAERVFLGFARTRESDGSTVVETERVQTVACPDGAASVTTSGYAGGVSPNPILRRERAVFEDTSGSGRLPHVCRPKTRYVDEYDYGATPRTYQVSLDYDVFGNPRSETDTFRAITRTYLNDQARYLVGPLATERSNELVGAGGARLAETRHFYDAAGNRERTERWDSETGAWFAAHKTFDARGNVLTTTDESGHQRAYKMDPTTERHVAQTCDAATCTELEYDLVLGAVIRETDANSATTRYAYDGFGRRTRLALPDGGCVVWQYHQTGTPSRQRIETYRCQHPNQNFDGLGSGLGTAAYFDGLERLYRHERSGGFEREVAYVGHTQLISEEGAWHEAGKPARSELFEYEQGRRVSKLIHGDGSFVEHRYALGEEAIIDELGHVTYLRRDERGQLRQIEQQVTIGGSLTPVLTQYEVDALGRQTAIVDHAGHRTERTWSSLGREVMSCDPDRGCVALTYRPNGQLESRTDALGQRIELEYDGAGRPVLRRDSGGGKVEYHYDVDPSTGSTSGASRGRLVRIAGTRNGNERYRYDLAGRVEYTEKCVSGTCVEWAQSHDLAGRLSTTTYPEHNGRLGSGSEVVTYTYDSAGRVQSLTSPLADYAPRIGYDAEDRVVVTELGNGVEASYGFHPARAWLETVTVAKGGAPLFEATYELDVAGRTRQVTWTDTATHSLEAAHDELSRLLMVKSSSGAFDYEYDALGNLTRSSAVGAFRYDDGDHVHAVTEAGPHQYQYDAIGQLRAGGGRALKWNLDGFPREITTGQGTTKLDYDASGNRVVKDGPNGTSRYFGALIELDPSGKPVHHYRAGKLHIATRDASGVRWPHRDRLGSVRLTTDAGAGVLQRFTYEPFGVESTSGGVATDAFGFGGHRGDDETGLVYMRARYYDPVIGRFISPDSIIPNPLDPQTLNRYSYADNAPLDRIDPDGHASKCPDTPNTTCVKGTKDPDPGVVRMLKEWLWSQHSMFDRRKFAQTHTTLVRRGRDEVIYPEGRGYGKPYIYVTVCPSCHYERANKPGDLEHEISKQDKETLVGALSAVMNLVDRTGRAGSVLAAYADGVDFVVTDQCEVKTQSVSDKELSRLYDALLRVEVDESKVPEGGAGRKGNNLTRAQNGAISDVLRAEDWTVTNGGNSGNKEFYQPGFEGGKKGSVWFDTTATKNGTTLHVQTVDTRATPNPETGSMMTVREERNDTRGWALTPKDTVILPVPKQTRTK